MELAIRSVTNGTSSVRKAALDYGITKSTLYGRLSEKVQAGAKCGAPRYLTDQEECELEEFLIVCTRMGFGRTRQDVILLVGNLLKSRGLQQQVSSGWWEGFCCRHPNIRLRTPASLSKSRALATDPKVIDRYFDILEETLNQNDLYDKPYQIYNVDETGMPLDPNPMKIVCKRGEKNPSIVTTGKKEQVTVVGCVNAGGVFIPPMIIWNTKQLRAEQTIDEVPGSFYGLSTKGWMDQGLFYLWFTKHFLRYAVPTRPIILLLDGHSSHYSPETIRLAAKHKVILFTFPPNTTHLTQPLDKGIFGPLKIHWRQECQKYIQENPYKIINRFSFGSIFHKAWMKSMISSNITKAFRIVGVYPFNREALKVPISSSPTKKFADKSKLYIPLCSPTVTHQPHVCTSSTLDSSPSPSPLVNVSYSSSEHSSSPSPSHLFRSPVNFTDEEIKRFQRRWENGYDIKTDDRYNLWLEQNCNKHSPDGSDDQTSECRQAMFRSSFSRFLKLPSPPTVPVHLQVKSDRVLTSYECIRAMEEKEKEKKRKLEQKQARQEEQRRRKEEKLEQIRQKQARQEEQRRRKEEKLAKLSISL